MSSAPYDVGAAAPVIAMKPISIGRLDYGIDAPGVIRNLFIVAAAGLGLYFSARLGLWSGVIGPINLGNSGIWPGLACGAMGFWMIYDSRDRTRAEARGRVLIHDIRHVREYGTALAGQGLTDVTYVGSRAIRVMGALLTFGSLRPDIVTARYPGR
jgi:hypothetical protein